MILNKLVNKFSIKLVTSFVAVFMIFNISISSLAAQRQYERRENIKAENEIDIFLDKYYPDEVLDKVFVNKIEK